MRLNSVVLALGMVVVGALLAACETTEEKAEQRYQEAMELHQSGEDERAVVALKNVFKLDGEHRDARMLYASIKRDQGDLQEAYRHYLLVSEQYPDDLDSRVQLARMAVEMGGWDRAVDHLTAASEIASDAPELDPLQLAVDYRDAVESGDTTAIEAAAEDAEQLQAQHPENRLLHRILIDSATRTDRLSTALDYANAALEHFPENREFNQLKLNILAQLQDMDALGAHLKVMVDRFPDDREVRTALVRWFLANNNPDGAERFIRNLVDRSGEEIAPRMALVQFLLEVRGTEAALDELDRLIADGPGDGSFRLLKASILFDTGERQRAISQVEDLISDRESGDQVREMKTTLARMLIAEGDEARARSLVEEVLAADETDVAALKMKASLLIEEDKVREAVLALRTALDQAPDDPDAITLMARAYERGGNRELMAESLSRAVDASNAAPEETMRYARYLISEDKFLPAEDVLLRALRLSPSNLSLLNMLARVYLEMDDVSRAEQVTQSIRDLGGERAEAVAKRLKATILQRTNRTDQSIALMEDMIEDGQSGLAAQAEIIRARLANGELKQARAFVDNLLAETPKGDPNRLGVEFLDAALTSSEGDVAAAQQIYRSILDRNPRVEPAWRALVATQARQGHSEKALALTEEALQALPDSASLRWMRAGLAEQTGDIDVAIDIYEDLYAEDSDATVIANNLASLITTYRDDEESLERAFVIARRLRDSDVPAFQDTYGWIAHRLGNQEEALSHLEPAAEGLPNDPVVQYHLARAYEAVGRHEEAVQYYERAVQLWTGSTLTLAERAREELAAAREAMASGADDGAASDTAAE